MSRNAELYRNNAEFLYCELRGLIRAAKKKNNLVNLEFRLVTLRFPAVIFGAKFALKIIKESNGNFEKP